MRHAESRQFDLTTISRAVTVRYSFVGMHHKQCSGPYIVEEPLPSDIMITGIKEAYKTSQAPGTRLALHKTNETGCM